MRCIGLLVLLLAGCGDDSATVASRKDAVEAGSTLYARYGCAVCHGPEGRGDGPVGRSMNPKPRDFRDPEAFKGGRSLGAISETILDGVMRKGVGMPGYPHIPEDERRAIAAYVASLGEEKDE